MLLTLAMILIMLAANGCTTVTPAIVESPHASWDGTNQNSGFIRWVGDCEEGTPHLRARYNAMIATYGKRFAPPITEDYGITATVSNTYIFTPEAIQKFTKMNRWRKLDAVTGH